METHEFHCHSILGEINFGKIWMWKIAIFYNFRDSKLWILVNLGLEEWLLFAKKSKFRPSKSAKNDIFDHLNSQEVWSHVKSKWADMQIVIFPHCAALTSHFESFWIIVCYVRRKYYKMVYSYTNLNTPFLNSSWNENVSKICLNILLRN